MADDYDPATCITAGELRAMGADIGPGIPDCAWLPRAALRSGENECSTAMVDETGTLHVRWTVRVEAPFRWVSFAVSIGAGGVDAGGPSHRDGE